MSIKKHTTYQAYVIKSSLLLLLSIGLCKLSACTYHKAEEPVPSTETSMVSYEKDIQPIIATHCYSCHSASATDPDKAGYAFLDDFEELKRYALRKSTTNPAYTKLQARIRFIEFPGMPLKSDPLREEDIQKIELWIKAGAPNN